MSKKFEHWDAVLYIIDRLKKDMDKCPDLILSSSLDILIKLVLLFFEDFLIEKGVVRKDQFYDES